MRARTSAVIGRDGRLVQLHCEPPLTLRQVRTDDSATCALCLIGTAAGPLANDDLALSLTLLDGARATLQAAGASLVQGSGGARALRTHVTLEPRATLVARPGAVIVARGSQVDIAVSIDLATEAAVEWRELLVLGRTGEPPGAATLRWDVVRSGRPVLRQHVDLADQQLAGWPAMIAGARVLATALISDPALTTRTVVASSTAVAAQIDDHTVLVTVLSSDAAIAMRVLDDLCARATNARATANQAS